MQECCKSKVRSKEEQKKLINRLSRIEGQIRGVKRMIEADAYCPDILVQVSAITSAINSFSKELLEAHIRSCVVQEIKEDDPDTIDVLMKTLRRLMK